jgi:hypothetical protein
MPAFPNTRRPPAGAWYKRTGWQRRGARHKNRKKAHDTAERAKARATVSKNDSGIQISRQKTAQGFKKRFSESGGTAPRINGSKTIGFGTKSGSDCGSWFQYTILRFMGSNSSGTG